MPIDSGYVNLLPQDALQVSCLLQVMHLGLHVCALGETITMSMGGRDVLVSISGKPTLLRSTARSLRVQEFRGGSALECSLQVSDLGDLILLNPISLSSCPSILPRRVEDLSAVSPILLLLELAGMVKIGWDAHHEQYTPTELLEYAVLAEKAGFDSIWTADHFHPWTSKAPCNFAWVWIASAAERTKKVSIGTGVTCPILRYNPAIVAQAFATLGCMYPDRIFLGVGTGEPLNEMPVGCDWPPFRERSRMLEEAVRVIKALWSQECVSFKGKYYSLRKATLYTKPKKPPPLYVAANGPTVTRIAGKYADGFVTNGNSPPEHYHNVLFPALEEGARSAGRNPETIEKVAELFMCYGEDYDKTLASARFWAPVALPNIWYKYPIYDPAEMEACGDLVGDEQIARLFCVTTEPEDLIKRIEQCSKLGFDHVYITGSNPDERKTFEVYQKKVLPYFKSKDNR